MSNSVFFSKLRVNDTTKNVTIYVTSQPRQQASSELEGVAFGVRVQQDVANGQLNLIDPATGTSLKSNHPAVKKFKTYKPGKELKGFVINKDAPVLDLETGEPLRNLYWVEAAQ
jgi:hypothetical protein